MAVGMGRVPCSDSAGRSLSTFLPICSLILLCLLVTAFLLPAFLFSGPSFPLHGPVTYRKGKGLEKYQWKCSRPELYSERQESERILASVRRNLLQAARQLESVNLRHETVTKEMTDARNELKNLLLDIEDTKLYHRELLSKNRAPLYLPMAPVALPLRNKNALEHPLSQRASFETVFDFSKCSIAGSFGIYLYTPGMNASEQTLSYYEIFKKFEMVTNRASDACLLIAIVDSDRDVEHLKYWNNGRNHVILNVATNPLAHYPNSVIVSSVYKMFKDNFDITLHLRVPDYDKYHWQKLPPLLPLTRKYLLSCVGVIPKSIASSLKAQIEFLANSAESVGDRIFLDFTCDENCSLRSNIFGESMFALILFGAALGSSEIAFHDQLLTALRSGAVPIITTLQPPLPFLELLDWRRAVYRIPLQRLSELHFILRSFAPNDILELRRQGRFLLENYFIDKKAVAEGLIAALRQRIGVPGSHAAPVKANPLFGDHFTAPHLIPVKPPEEEYMGPREAPHNSTPFTHNYTSLQMYSYNLWNNFGNVAGRSLEYMIDEPPFPSQFEYGEGPDWGFRPISPPGSGASFSAALGGNRPREQFTVVILTYQRDSILAAALERLNNMPYLNKVLVVWNGREAPVERSWPRLHVPVIFINSTVNSLNNRFLPFEQINTEAVLSLDDDIDLKQHEIIFAFRVWREQRAKIVGFPARRHSQLGNEIFYDSNHTCQLSMILTGAAFIHKAYFYAYTYGMPEVIREKVDALMNCEDLAMNFLIAHLTRQPPIKTTSKWTLRCPACKTSLYNRTGHYQQRHECIRFFTEVYGYNPLLFTQLRVDSVLFKTRLPVNHQKCFKYV